MAASRLPIPQSPSLRTGSEYHDLFLIAVFLTCLPFVVWLIYTLMHDKHLPWETRILNVPLLSRPPTHPITQLNLITCKIQRGENGRQQTSELFLADPAERAGFPTNSENCGL